MIGWILLGLVAGYLFLTAVFGLATRIHRSGIREAVVAPSQAAVPWFSVGVILIVSLVGWRVISLVSGGIWVVILLLIFFALLGWDEFYDRACPAFHACLRREMYGFFATPIPYFVLFLFTLLSGVLFWLTLYQVPLLTLRFSFGSIAFFGFFLFPLLTMGLFARERSEGTIEVLMTAPVSDATVVVSKFLATMLFYVVMLSPTLVFYAVMNHIGERADPRPISVDVGPVITGVVGMLLMGAFFASLGLMVSSLTSSQILAALLSWVLIILFLIVGSLPARLGFGGTTLARVMESVGIGNHLEQFLMGVIDPKEVVYFLSFTVFFLFLTVRSVESRKWR